MLEYWSKPQFVAKLLEHYEFSPKVTIDGQEWPCSGDPENPYYGYVSGFIAGISPDDNKLLVELTDAIQEAFGKHFPVAEVVILTTKKHVAFNIRSTLAPPLPRSLCTT